MSDDLQRFVKEREKQLKSSKEALESNKSPDMAKPSVFGQNESKMQKWWRGKKEQHSKS